MISQQEIAEWRPYAPWSDDLMVEQDYLLTKAVQTIFGDPKLRKQLAMRGGTVLHKAHLAPASRYSEDIDLVLTANRSAGGIRDDIAGVLHPLLGDPTESFLTDVRLTVRNMAMKSRIARLNYDYEPTSMLAARAKLKIEINLNERDPIYNLTTVQIDVPQANGTVGPCPVVSYDLDEMLGTKMRALIQRDHGRDLYDLWKAIETIGAPSGARSMNPQRVGEAFRFYMKQEGSSYSRSEIAEMVDRRMKSRKFLNDMDGYLPASSIYDPKLAHQAFRDHLLPHL